MAETVELTRAEVAEVQKHSESLNPPSSPAEAFEKFAGSMINHRKAEAKEKPEPKDAKPFDLSKAKPEQLKEWNETGTVTPKAEAKKSAPEPEAKAETKASNAKEGDIIDVRAEVEPSVRKLGERAWTEQLQGKDRDDYLAHVNKQVETGMGFIEHHERSHEIQSGLRNLLAGLPQVEAQARFHDFSLALSEVRNPGAVLAEIGLDQVTRNVLAAVRNRQEMRQVVFGLAVELAQKARSAKAAAKAEADERRPRAPKPPSEVGGRGAPPERGDLAAARSGDFRQMDAHMRSKYGAGR